MKLSYKAVVLIAISAGLNVPFAVQVNAGSVSSDNFYQEQARQDNIIAQKLDSTVFETFKSTQYEKEKHQIYDLLNTKCDKGDSSCGGSGSSVSTETVQSGDAETLKSANAYTDQASATLRTELKSNQQLNTDNNLKQDNEINKKLDKTEFDKYKATVTSSIKTTADSAIKDSNVIRDINNKNDAQDKAITTTQQQTAANTSSIEAIKRTNESQQSSIDILRSAKASFLDIRDLDEKTAKTYATKDELSKITSTGGVSESTVNEKVKEGTKGLASESYVNNTVSNAVSGKANSSDLDQKADKTDLAGYAKAEAVQTLSSAIDAKADKSEVQSIVDTAISNQPSGVSRETLDAKADVSTVNGIKTELADKVSSDTLKTAMDQKVDKYQVKTELDAKANKTELVGLAKSTEVDSKINTGMATVKNAIGSDLKKGLEDKASTTDLNNARNDIDKTINAVSQNSENIQAQSSRIDAVEGVNASQDASIKQANTNASEANTKASSAYSTASAAYNISSINSQDIEHLNQDIYTVNQNSINRDKAVLNSANAYTDQKFGEMSSKIDKVEKNANRGIASVAAMANISPVTGHDLTLSVAGGVYKGESAIAVGGVKRLTDSQTVKFSIGSTGSGAVVGGSWNMGF